jgi:hypothetical protein
MTVYNTVISSAVLSRLCVATGVHTGLVHAADVTQQCCVSAPTIAALLYQKLQAACTCVKQCYERLPWPFCLLLAFIFLVAEPLTAALLCSGAGGSSKALSASAAAASSASSCKKQQSSAQCVSGSSGRVLCAVIGMYTAVPAEGVLQLGSDACLGSWR